MDQANLIHMGGCIYDPRIGCFHAGSGRALSAMGRAAKISAHASGGGVMSVLQGGKFGHRFVSAGFGEAVSPAVARWAGDSTGKQFVVGVVIGGAASRLAGGKFANGAR